MKLSDKYVDLVAKLTTQADIDKRVLDYKTNLEKIREDIIKFSNALSDLISAGEIVDIDADVYYDGSGIEFYGDTRLGHKFYLRITADRPSWISLSLEDGDRGISWEEPDVDVMIRAIKSINYLRVVFANDRELFDFYVNPHLVTETVRENE